jgi:hypothetical protein
MIKSNNHHMRCIDAQRNANSFLFPIMTYEEDIDWLNISIQQREQLLKQDSLSDEVKQLANYVGTRSLSSIFLQKLKDGSAFELL